MAKEYLEKLSELVLRLNIEKEVDCRIEVKHLFTGEPVFGNLPGNKQLNRFTLRGNTKVDGQWKLYCLMRNIESWRIMVCSALTPEIAA